MLWNEIAYKKMSDAEREYLQENGWSEGSEGRWTKKDANRFDLHQGHAVNCQKQYDRIFARVRRAPIE